MTRTKRKNRVLPAAQMAAANVPHKNQAADC